MTSPFYQTARFEGSYREASEDRAVVLPTDSGGVVLAVADGVGGRAGGGPAAEMAVALVREALPRLASGSHRDYQRFAAALDDALAGDADAGETTLVLVGLTARRLVGVSVGDSEAWLVTPEGRYDLTGGQRRKPYLGSGAAVAVPFEMPRPSGGTLVVASDGLFKYALPERIEETALLPDLDEAARRTAGLARLPKGAFPDDIAVLLCRLSDAAGTPMLSRLRAALLPPRRAPGAETG